MKQNKETHGFIREREKKKNLLGTKADTENKKMNGVTEYQIKCGARACNSNEENNFLTNPLICKIRFS